MKLNEMKVAIKAQGFESVVDVSEYPEETIQYWLTYGVRRAYQDGINSIAKSLRDEGQEVDGAALFADRDKVFREATMGQRSGGASGFDEVERAMIAFVRPKVKGAIGGYKDMTPAERDKAVWEAIAKQSDAAQDSIRKHAEKMLAQAKAEREALSGLSLEL